MHSRELDLLIKEYKDAATNEDKLILRKLEAIAYLCADCKSDELIFANEITVEFCRLIKLLREQHRIELAKATSGADNFASHHEGYVPYLSDDELMAAFSEYLYDKYKTTGKPTPATIKDYLARINTFSTIYLWDIPRIVEIWHQENEKAKQGSIQFVYKYLELILASFETKVDGAVNKQRSNIRSALSKLNEFKREQEFRR